MSARHDEDEVRRELEKLRQEIEDELGRGTMSCPSCGVESDHTEWPETWAERPDPHRFADEAYLDDLIDSALLTCPRCGHTETRKELQPYLEFEGLDHGRWPHERIADRIVWGSHKHPTWRRRLVLGAVIWVVSLTLLTWWIVDRAGLNRAFDGGADLLAGCSLVLLVFSSPAMFRTIREIRQGRGDRRSEWSV